MSTNIPSNKLESELYSGSIDPADEIPEPKAGIEYEPETKPKTPAETSDDLPNQIKACRQKALDQFLELIDDYLLEVVKENPYAMIIDLNKSTMVKRASSASIIPSTLSIWIRRLMQKHFEAFGIKIEFYEAGRSWDWHVKITLPVL